MRSGPTVTGSSVNIIEDHFIDEVEDMGRKNPPYNYDSVIVNLSNKINTNKNGRFWLTDEKLEENILTLKESFKKEYPHAAESIIAAGNNAFKQKNFPEAIKQYTLAIELSQESPDHSYFVKRANAYLESGLFEKAIADCN